MDEKIAKENLKNGGVGIGFDTAGAQEYVALSRKYKLEDLDGKWAVDVGRLLSKLGISTELNYKTYLAVIDSTVLEEVCHTAGYAHHEREDLNCATDFFLDLAVENYEYSDSNKSI